MGIQYVLEHPCRPKTELGEEHLINLVKSARKLQPSKGVANVESAIVMDVPSEYGGTAGVDDAVRKDIAALEYYVSDCMSCPANVSSEGTGGGVPSAFGCIYELQYPISGFLEDVLLYSAFAAIEDPRGNPGYRILNGVLKVHPKGRTTPAHRIRRMGTEYFERKAPKEAKVELEGRKATIDTDQLVTILMTGPVPPQAGVAVATMLERGVERAKKGGIQDVRVSAPLLKVCALAKAGTKLGKPVRISY